ncbi:MAG: diguanylate cyclase [Gammaproteobacteria bacterium]|nr:diguanylate cyclase [Gammaproteobacteria bacterium]MBL6998362.1 diguanylate cyclase [Gammaproteobacteria bacterium]
MQAALSVQAQSLDKVSLQLAWKYQFETAGFIMAKENGYYQEAGLDVELKEYATGVDIVEDVLSQKSNYGLHNSSVVIENGKIKPVILMATYYQQSPLVFVVSKDIKTPKDLIGKSIMGTTDELKYSSLALLLSHFYVNRKNTIFTDHNFHIEDFISGKVAAMSAFRTNQLYLLDSKNIEYNIIDPADYGFFMSAVNLFTSHSEAINQTDRTRRFIEASNKGWTYALEHPEETVSIIYQKYSQLKSPEALLFEASVTRKMMLLDFFDIGATNKDLSLRSVSQFHFSGLLEPDQQLGNFIFEEVSQEFSKNVNFTDQQKLYLQGKKQINMCVDPEWMPFESIRNGQHIGIAADIFEKFSAFLPIPIQLVETHSWQESLFRAKSRDCDIFSLASSTVERNTYMDFTSPYINLPIVMATNMEEIFIADIETVKHKKFGVVKGYAIADILRKSFSDINIVDVNSISDGLKRVENGELYGYIDNLMVIADAIQKDFTGVLKVSSRLNDEVRLAVGTRNDQPELNQIFEILVRHLDEKSMQSIYNRWVSVKQDVAFDYGLFWKLLAIIVFLSVAYFYYYIKLKSLNVALLKLSITDKLTGLFNRVKMDQVLIQYKSAMDRYGANTALILLDVDLFKNVNDTYGHPAGDAVLIELSNLIKKNIRKSDYAGRWGGEEFLIVCPNINQDAARVLAEKISNKIRKHDFSGIGKVTVSAGVSEFSKHLSVQKSISNVDKALYQSKQGGRDRVTVYA